MKRIFVFAAFGSCAWIFGSCNKEAQPTTCSETKISHMEVRDTMANVRIKNETGMDLCQVILNSENNSADAIDGGDIYYGNLLNNHITGYTAVEGIREIAYIHATTPKSNFYIDPTDYVGLDPLANGKYTFVIKKYSGTCDSCLTITVLPD